jgi:hypothetical protein
MKKIALILALLLAIGGFAVAELEPTVTGEASIALGLDLDQATWGFVNSSDSSLTLTLVSGSAEKMGEGAWYGVIELADFSIEFDDAGTHYELEAEDDDDDAVDLTYSPGIADEEPDEVFVNIPVSVTVPDITAKITDGNLYFQFASEPDFDADYVAEIEEDEAIDFDLGDDITGGFEFGGSFAPITFALSLGTERSYEDDYHPVTDQSFPVELVLGADVAPLMVDVALATGFGRDFPLGAAVQLKADVDPLSVTAAFDFISRVVAEGADPDTDYEISATVSAAVAMLDVSVGMYYGEWFVDADDDDADDIADDTALDVTIGLDADLAPLTVGVDVAIDDLAKTDDWTVDVDVSFAASEDITVEAGAGYGKDEVLSADAKVTLTGIIDPMTFTLAWEDADDLTDVGDDKTEVFGQIVFMGEISY